MSRSLAVTVAEREIDQTTSSSEVISADEAVAFAALDAGIAYSSAYPGTPTTDIQETILKHADLNQVKALWSINEKVAYESALAVAIGGQRALVSMKQVGLNVAADAFMNSCPAGVNGGLVLVVGDEPACHSSQNKQDTRHYRNLSGAVLLEPSDSQEAYDMTREAFAVSERFSLPVIIRLTTRTAYGCTPVLRRKARNSRPAFSWPKQPERFFIVPQVSRRLFKRLLERQVELGDWLVKSSYTVRRLDGLQARYRRGVLCTGIGYPLAKENVPHNWSLLKVAGEPFPDDLLSEFVRQHDEVLVLEEGDPLLEARVRHVSKGTKVRGRLSDDLTQFGELQVREICAAIEGTPRPLPPPNTDLPTRLPEICKPCGYHKVFAALKEIPDIATPSDIGCNSLGGMPPYSVMDGVWAMGSSIGVACGLAAMGHSRVLAIIGDSTFYHAGLPPLIEAVQEGYRLTVLLLDNGTAAMTGGQPVPHHFDSAPAPLARKIDLALLIKAIGVRSCTTFDPHVLGVMGIRELVSSSFEVPGVKVLLYRSQCGLFTPGYHTSEPFSLKQKGG